jgi:uncharacterized membrane protein YeaQ/YmgE (transglycosylase-associated protein family)
VTFLRHPLYSILAVILIGMLGGAIAHYLTRRTGRLSTSILVGLAGAFLGFHAAMLSNAMTGMVIFPFIVTATVSALVLAGWRMAGR